MKGLIRWKYVNWYGVFFTLLLAVAISCLIGIIGTTLYADDSHGGPLVDAAIMIIACWITVAASDDYKDPKYIFWVGLALFVGLHIIGAIGCGILSLVM